MNIYCVFDFCQTICSFETADTFIDFISRHEQNKRIRFIERKQNFYKKTGLLFFFDVIGHFFHVSLNKRIELKKIKGISKKKIDEYSKLFYEKEIRPKLIQKVVDQIMMAKKNNMSVVIVSASFYPILVHFKKEFSIDLLITNDFEYKDGCATGRITRKDCIYKNKVKYLYQSINQADSIIEESYGDSKSDIPILAIAKKKIVVSKGKHKKWANPKIYKEIIWNE